MNTFTEYSQANPAVACSAAGAFVVVWDGGLQDGDSYGIFAQRVDSDGVKAGTEFRVNSYSTGTQQLPTVAATDGGDFVVAWESYDDQDGDGYGIFGRRYSSAGVPNGTEFQVNTYTTNSQQKPAVGVSPNGDFTVAWSSPHDGDGYGVFARNFASTGVPTGTADFQVNTYTLGDQGALSSAGHVLSVARGGGTMLIAWQSIGVVVPQQDGDGAGVFAQRYAIDGAVCAGDCNGDGRVTIDELTRGVGIILATIELDRCPAMDVDGSGSVAINEIVKAVNNALTGCR